MPDIALKGKDITFIESSFEEDILLEAEALLEENAVSGKYHEKAALWELIVQDASFHFHTNIRLLGDRIEDFDCNCNFYHQKAICRHIAAGLLFVRKQATNEQEQVLTREAQKPGRSFKSFLNQINSEELAEFVRDHARSDQWFKLKLQARFYEKKNDSEKERFIEGLFPVITKNQAKAPARRISIFVKISQELLVQFNAYIQQNDLLEAFRLVFFLLKKSFYIKYHYIQSQERFIENHEKLLRNFHETLDLIEAPEFKISALKDLLDLISSSYISLHSRQEKQLWICLLRSTIDKRTLYRVSQQFLSPPIKDYTTYYFILGSELLILEGKQRDEAIRAMSNQEIYRVVHTLTDYLDLPLAEDTLKRIFMIYDLNNPLATHALKHLGKQSIDQDLIGRVIHFFDRYEKRFFVQWLSDHNGLTYEDLMIHLDGRIGERNTKLYVDILCAYGLYDEAADIMEKSPRKELLSQYDRELARYVPERLVEVYLRHAGTYLSEHFGIHARQYVNHLLFHLKEFLDPHLVREIEGALREMLKRKKVKQ